MFMSNSAGISRKAENAYPTGAPDPCSQFFSGVRVAHLLLLFCIHDFSYFMFFVMSVFYVWSFDYHYNLASLDFSFTLYRQKASRFCRIDVGIIERSTLIKALTSSVVHSSEVVNVFVD